MCLCLLYATHEKSHECVCDLLLSIFLGMKPFVVISDVNLAKEISVKHFDKFMNRFVSGCMGTCFLKYASIYKY